MPLWGGKKKKNVGGSAKKEFVQRAKKSEKTEKGGKGFGTYNDRKRETKLRAEIWGKHS